MSEEQQKKNNTFNLPSFECLDVSVEGGTMWIRLNRPHQMHSDLKMLKGVGVNHTGGSTATRHSYLGSIRKWRSFVVWW